MPAQCPLARPHIPLSLSRSPAALRWLDYSEAVIVRDADAPSFRRARMALEDSQCSDPSIVCAHFDPAAPLTGRPMLLKIRVLGLRYLCPTAVATVRDEPHAFSFRYDTFDGHVERGLEWLVKAMNELGEMRFRIEARWQQGNLTSWPRRCGSVTPMSVGRVRKQARAKA